MPFALATVFALVSLAEAPRIKAIVYHDYGGPEVLRLEEIVKPVPTDDEILIKVRAASVNPLDWHYMEGIPYVARMMGFGLTSPKRTRLGVDFAGTVEAVGKKVTQFKPGDEVFGAETGAFAEYLTVRADDDVVLKPANLPFEQAAAIPIAAVTALQAVRDHAKVQPGQKVLINGASGGVGTFAVQIAKASGAEVTGVCSTRNLDMVRSLGADHVIDYTKDDFTQSGQRYDVIIDNVGTRPLLASRRALVPKGKYILVGGGGPNDGRWIGALTGPLRALVLSRLVSQDMGMMLAHMSKQDLTVLGDLMQSGKIKSVIDRRYKLGELPEAIRYLEAGHARGKVVITVDGDSPLFAATAAHSTSPGLIAFTLIGVIVGTAIVPIVAAFALNRRFRRRNPEKRSYRWGYYYSILSFVAGLGLGALLDAGVTGVLLCGVFYAVLAWFFAKRQHWAWLALTILSFNPIVWIINAFYLRRRWAEA